MLNRLTATGRPLTNTAGTVWRNWRLRNFVFVGFATINLRADLAPVRCPFRVPRATHSHISRVLLGFTGLLHGYRVILGFCFIFVRPQCISKRISHLTAVLFRVPNPESVPTFFEFYRVLSSFNIMIAKIYLRS